MGELVAEHFTEWLDFLKQLDLIGELRELVQLVARRRYLGYLGRRNTAGLASDVGWCSNRERIDILGESTMLTSTRQRGSAREAT